jgi:metal-responsive CopG/Arc/MetJ family transcriptional regulator
MMSRGEGEKIQRLPISFPEDMYEWLREAAFRRHMKMAELVREAVTEYRIRQDPQLDLPIHRGKGERGQ